MVPLDVDDALAGLRVLLGRVAGPHIDLVIEVEPGLPRVRFDATAFRRVLIDLVQAASAAIPERGRITVRAHRDADRVVLSVADTGPGGSQGADAVLAAVQELVEASVAPTPGGGATFSIYVPVET